MASILDDKTILIVDDDRDFTDALVTWFKLACTATILTAFDGNAAYDVAIENRPDLIILDIMLPKRSGFLVLEKLRKKDVAPYNPAVIVITGNQGKRYRDFAEHFGVNDFFNKPFKLNTLFASAEKVFQSKPNAV